MSPAAAAAGIVRQVPLSGWLAAPRRLGMGREWGWLLGLAGADWLWCCSIGMRFDTLGPQLLVIAGLAAASIGYRRLGRGPRIADALDITAQWIGFSIAACILTYLFATWALAPQDALFARLDIALGFDWLRWLRFVDAHPLLHWPLAVAYASFMPQLLIAILYFAFTGRHSRNRALFRAAFIALVISAALSGLLPALSAFSHYGLPERAPYLHDLMVLRTGGTASFSVPRLQGIITMPSYHAVLGVLLAYSFRRTGLPGAIMIGWNMLMLVSIPSEGGHYLVDVIAGLAVAAVSIWLARRSFSAPADAPRP